MSNGIVHRHAAKYLKRFPKETKDRIKDILKQIENNPLKHSGIKQLFIILRYVPLSRKSEKGTKLLLWWSAGC